MKTLLRLVLSSIAVLIIAQILPNVEVTNFGSALLVALVLGILRVLVRPIFIILTLPVTILTLGLFLFVINALMILLVDYFVDGFRVNGFWTAMFFSIILSILQTILYSFLKDDVKTNVR